MARPKKSDTVVSSVPSVTETELVNKYSVKFENDEQLCEEDQKNRREILKIFRYDPFENETIHDQKQLYRDLVSMCDEAIGEDLPKMRGAITLVRSYLRADRLTEAIQKLSIDAETMIEHAKELKTMTEMLTKETEMITKTVKDFGFAERYAIAKSRGSGTLGAVVRDIENFNYDDGKVNLYDIETSASMQQAADISAAAMIKQISLSEAEYSDMLKEQREKLAELYRENKRLREENRLIYKQITKQELLKELAQDLESKGLGRREIQAMVLSEIKFDDDKIKEIFAKYKEANND